MDPDDYETTQTKPAHSDPPENDIIHHRKNLISKAMDETDDEDETPTTPTSTSSADELDLDEDDSRTELQSLSTMDTEAFRRLREERRKESRRRDKKKQQVASIKKQQATSIKKKQQVATVAGSTHKSQGVAAAAAANNNSNSSKYNKKSSTPTSSPSPTHVTTSRRRTNVAFSKHSNNQQEDTSTIGSSTVSSGYYSNTSNASGSTSGTDYRSRFSRRHNRGGSGSNAAENCCGLLLNRLPIFQLTILSMAIIILIQLDVMEVNLEKTTGIMGLRGSSSKLVYDYTPYQEGAQPARTLGALPKDDDDYKTDDEDGKGKDENKENKEDESKLDALLSEDEKSGSGGDRYSKVLQQENMIGQVMPQSIMDGNHNAIQNIQSQSNGSQLQQEEEQQVGKKSNWDNLGAPISQQQQTENTFQGSDNVQAGDQQQPQGAQVVSWVKENAPPSTSEGDVGEGEGDGRTIFQQQTQPQQQQLGVIGGVVGGNIDSGVVGEDLNAVINNQAPPQQQQLPAVESTSEQYFRQAVVEQQQQQVQVVGEQQQQQPPLFTQQVQQAQQMQMQQQGDQQDLQPSLGDETTFSQLVQQLHQQPQQQTNQEVEQPLEQQPSLQQDTQLQVQSQGEGEVESSSQAVSSEQQLIDPAAQSSPVVAVASDLQNSISEKEKKLKQLQQMLAERQKQFQAAVPAGEVVQLKEEEEESPTQVDGGGEDQMVDNTGDATQNEQGGDVNQLPNSEEEQPQLKSETGNGAGENNREGLASSNLQEQQQHEEEQPMVNQNELNELRAASMNISNLRGGAVPQEVSQGEGESNVVNDQNEDVEVNDVERHDGSDEEVKESEQLDQSAKEDSPQDNGGEEEKETANNQSQEESRADTPVVIQQQNLITDKPAGTNSGVIVGQQAHQRGSENFALPDGDFIAAVDENGNIINDPNAPLPAAAVEVAPSPKDEDDVDLTDIDPFKNDSRNFQVKMPANALTEEEKVQLAQLEKEEDASPKEEMTLAEKLAHEG